jgi:hypothetical protein
LFYFLPEFQDNSFSGQMYSALTTSAGTSICTVSVGSPLLNIPHTTEKQIPRACAEYTIQQTLVIFPRIAAFNTFTQKLPERKRCFSRQHLRNFILPN